MGFNKLPLDHVPGTGFESTMKYQDKAVTVDEFVP